MEAEDKEEAEDRGEAEDKEVAEDREEAEVKVEKEVEKVAGDHLVESLVEEEKEVEVED